MTSRTAGVAAAHDRNPRPSRRRWPPADAAAADGPEARRTRLLIAAADGTPLTPEVAAALLGGGWTGARLARLRSGTRVAAGSVRSGAFRVWQAGDGLVRLSSIDGLRAVGSPMGRPRGAADPG